jgi:carbonic anhydrase/acetyltransferase-like protein (isoleucine patch superfamily)
MALRAVRGQAPQLDPTAFVAEGAELSGAVQVGPQASIWYGAVLRGDIEPIQVGAESNVQDGCVVHTDPGYPCRIGRAVTVGHRAVLHGCVIEDGALIGMGAVVLNGAHVGPGALVAAGSLVPEGAEVPAGTVVMGAPARPVRPVRPAEAERMRQGVLHYQALAAAHRGAPTT